LDGLAEARLMMPQSEYMEDQLLSDQQREESYSMEKEDWKDEEANINCGWMDKGMGTKT
jgi:hypothetical protein